MNPENAKAALKSICIVTAAAVFVLGVVTFGFWLEQWRVDMMATKLKIELERGDCE